MEDLGCVLYLSELSDRAELNIRACPRVTVNPRPLWMVSKSRLDIAVICESRR